MSSKIGVQNIAHTNGTVAATVSSGGVVAFNNPPTGIVAGSRKLLLNHTISSAVALFDVDNTYINATYDTYEFQCMFHPVTNGARVEYKFFDATSTGSAGAIPSGNNHSYSIGNWKAAGNRASNGGTTAEVSYSTIGNLDGEALAFSMTLYNANDLRMPASTSGIGVNSDINGYNMGFGFSGGLVPTTTYFNHFCRGIRFEFDSGDIQLGSIKVYGVT